MCFEVEKVCLRIDERPEEGFARRGAKAKRRLTYTCPQLTFAGGSGFGLREWPQGEEMQSHIVMLRKGRKRISCWGNAPTILEATRKYPHPEK